MLEHVFARTANMPWERIDKSNAALLVVDHQVGLFQLVRDWSPVEYKTNVLGHAAAAKLFGLPVVMTTSAENGERTHAEVVFLAHC
jgi:nicotinamidase-related amidase